jgi:hypothetical protein
MQKLLDALEDGFGRDLDDVQEVYLPAIREGSIEESLPAAKVKALKPSGMTVATQGKLNKLVCAYPEDINLTYRTKGACAVDNAKACASDPATCKASCE